MRLSPERLYTAFILIVSLLLLLQVFEAYPEEFDAPEKTLAFLREVIGFDLVKYSAVLTSYEILPSNLEGMTEKQVKYTLNASVSTIDVICTFIGSSLRCCNLYLIDGSPIYTQQFANTLDMAKAVIARYRDYSGAIYIQTMKEMLDAVNELKNVTNTRDNVKLEISIRDYYTYIRWIYTSNGLDAVGKGVALRFEKGFLDSFIDQWNLFKIGSTNLKVSRDEAIKIAREQAEKYKLRIWTGKWTEVKFNVLNEPVVTELSMQCREPLTLYPFWRVQLYFDKVYYGWNGIEVGIWADTGEVVHVDATGELGSVPDYDPLTPTDDQTNPFLTVALATVLISLAIVVFTKVYRWKKSA